MRQQSGVHHAAYLPAKGKITGRPLIATVRILARAAARDWLANPGLKKAAGEINSDISRPEGEQ
jgi:hypothetical protein